MKLGRNDPCPCGSGKKYKKCCLAADEVRARAERAKPRLTYVGDLVARWDVGGERHVHPYSVIRFAEEDVVQSSFFEDPSRGERRTWTRPLVRALSNDDILAKLAALGVTVTRTDFVATASDHVSAWDLSDGWRDTPPRLPAEDDDFLGLAANELWRRWCADCPSIEMLDDQMQEGFALERERRVGDACDVWWTLWQTLRPGFRPEMRRTDDTRKVFLGLESVANWAVDFLYALRNAAIREVRYAERGATFAAQFLAQFPDEQEGSRDIFETERGFLLFLAGRRDEGERELREFIARRPDCAIGYAVLSDALARRRDGDPSADDVRAAVAVLETALALPVRDAADFDMEARLTDYMERLGDVGFEA